MSSPLRFVRFPPGRGNVFVPVAPRRDSRTGLYLYAACRRPVVVAQRLASWAVALGGSSLLPGRRQHLQPYVPAELLLRLLETWRRDLGDFDGFAFTVRRQPSRSGFAVLLLRAGTPVAFVKVREEAEPLDNERRALEIIGGRPLSLANVPSPLATGRADHITWLATSSMPGRMHGPERDAPVPALVAEIQDRLAELPRPAEAPPHWQPMHGDLTPWNLRRSGRRRWLLDWEDIGYGPPDADALYYRLTCASVKVQTPETPTVSDEAVAFWRERLAYRHGGGTDANLFAFLTDKLRRPPR